MNNAWQRITASNLWRAVAVCLGVFWSHASLASGDQTAAIAEAIGQAVTPAQISDLVTVAAGQQSPEADGATALLERLQHALKVDKGVALALLQILGAQNVPAERQTEDLAESSSLYHAVTQSLADTKLDDADAQLLVEQAQVAMTAGLFSDAAALIEQLETREAASDGERHRLAAARARTLLGKLALMNLDYEKATEAFELARQRIATVSSAGQAATDTPSADDGVLRIGPLTQQASARVATPAPMVTVVVRPSGKTEDAPPSAPPETVAAPVKVAAAIPLTTVRTVAPGMLKHLLSRGDAMFALGDLTAARLLYQRAAEAGDARGATGAAMTYDPWVLSQIGARGIQPDPALAAAWYRKALDLGDVAAAVGLKRLTQISSR